LTILNVELLHLLDNSTKIIHEPLILIVILLSVSCQHYPANIEKVLNLAAHNRPELEKALEHFRNDTMQYKACCFLIENMEGKHWLSVEYVNKFGYPIDVPIHKFTDTEKFKKYLDSLSKSPFGLTTNQTQVMDYHVITADYLIENIELAFDVWHKSKWCRKLNYDEFCEYILPYRVTAEKLTNWRPELKKRYAHLADSMDLDQSNPIEAAAALNIEVKNWAKLENVYYNNIKIRNALELYADKKGICDDLSNYITAAGRAIGIPLIQDNNPIWANYLYGHKWSLVKDTTGKDLYFLAAEGMPGLRPFWDHKPSKILRYTYKIQPQTLPMLVTDQDTIPYDFSSNCYIDVTDKYLNCSTLRVPLSVKDKFAYLFVFNGGAWLPAWWGPIVNGEAVFDKMITNVLYCIATYSNGEYHYIGDPFVFSADTHIQKISPNQQIIEKITCFADRYMDFSQKDKIVAGKKYKLYYWDKKWIFHGQKIAKDESIEFDSVPKGALLWLNWTKLGLTERPFLMREGKQIFY